LNTPPELAADIIEKGIVIAGGSALLRDLDSYIAKVTGVNTFLAEDALYCVAKRHGYYFGTFGYLQKSSDE